MSAGLGVTGIVAYLIGRSDRALHALFAGNARVVIIVAFLVVLVLVGALALYLDFVNLFLYLLRIFGRRR